ncbi:MAG: 3'(2'),5'-bisphosphate nucleotidase CysQ family protein [Lishizhenia sp.]
MKFESKHLIALNAAVEASKKIMEIYAKGFETEIKTDGSPVTEADLASSEIISEILSTTNIPILGEEKLKQPYSARKNWKENWCVDPVDGTKEFIAKNGEFVVNIALIEEHKPVFGLIASPVKKEIIFGGKAFGSYFSTFENLSEENKWIQLPELNTINSPCVMTSSRTHHSGNTLKIVHQAEAQYGKLEFIKMGSALKFFDLVQGNADVYPRFAPTMEWDIAAGQAIYEAIGGEVLHATKGIPLYYNKENLKNPYFIAKKKILNLTFVK